MDKKISVFSNPDFDSHEQVAFHFDKNSGLKAIVAIHNSHLGPALGGCRMWPYLSDMEALKDVLRLSRGMTYKSAVAGLPLGGGKSVIIGDPHQDKSDEIMLAMGRFIESFSGRYIAAEDSGTSVADLKLMSKKTSHVCGVIEKKSTRGRRSGDPSPATAYGVFLGIKAAVEQKLGQGDLKGIRVAVQGVGHVGRDLVRRLTGAGAEVWISDLYRESCEQVAAEFDVQAVGVEEIMSLDVDVFAPCAMGGIVNAKTLSKLGASIVAGSANNQLACAEDGVRLHEMGVLYAPDYVINAGGLIDVYYEVSSQDSDKMEKHIESIHDNLNEIFQRAGRENKSPEQIADKIAEERFIDSEKKTRPGTLAAAQISS